MNTPMNVRLRDYRMLWRAAVTHANPRLSGMISWGSLAVGIVIAASVAHQDGLRAALAWAWCMGAVFLLMDWAWRFMPGAVKLASPANAQLVPQMRRRLVELSCLLCCIGIAGIASAPYLDASELGGWLFWIVVLVVGSGLGAAGHPAGSAVVTAACFSLIFVDRLPSALTGALSHPLAVVLALPVYAGIVYLAVRAMFPQGGERHWNMLARRKRWAAAAAGNSDPLAERIAAIHTKGGYATTLRRDSTRRDARRLVLHALGPAHHLKEVLLSLGLIAAVVLALGVFTTWRIDSRIAADIGWLFACMLLVVPLLYCARLAQLPANLAAEQALVRLAPAMPASAAAFNVHLGRALLRQALAAWGLGAGAAVLLTALGGAAPEALLRVASLACMILPVVAVPLRKHASRTQGAAGAAATLLLVSIVESSLAGGVVHAFTYLPALPVAALVSIGFTIVVAVRRLRAMRHAPCAFPAGRMD